MIKAVIVAGGVGKRLGLGFNKVFAELSGVPLLAYTLQNFERCEQVDQIVICAGNPADGTSDLDQARTQKIVDEYGFQKVVTVVAGGSTRMASVEAGLLAADASDDDIVLVQDGSRPFSSPDLISKVLEAALAYDAAICGVTPKDTIQFINEDGFSVNTIDRSKLLAIHTPVAAKWKFLRDARTKASQEGYLDTPGFEDSAILQKYGISVKVVESSYTNVKVTTPEDLDIAAQLLREHEELRFTTNKQVMGIK